MGSRSFAIGFALVAACGRDYVPHGTPSPDDAGVDADAMIDPCAASPPDPSCQAPATNPTTPADFFDGTSFLYPGPNPIQVGVAPGTIDRLRVAVIRGRALDPTGAALAGVAITILDHPELGSTRTRADGVFDIAVNGGGVLVGGAHALRYSAIDQDTAFTPAGAGAIERGYDVDGALSTITLATGAVVRAIDYDAFGAIASDSNTSFDLPIGFAGGLADPATGLVPFGARDYRPLPGPWAAREPLGLLGGCASFFEDAA